MGRDPVNRIRSGMLETDSVATKHQWITTPAQKRDYLKLITILQECRKDWETVLKKGEPQPEPGEIHATIDAEQNFVNFYSVDRPNPHGITLKPLDLKEDGSLVAQDTKHTTTLHRIFFWH